MNIKNFIKQNIKLCLNKIMLPAVYNIYCRKPIQNGKVIFADSNTDTLPESMEQMYKYVSEQNLDIHFHLTDIRKCGFKSMIKYLFGFMKDYATAEYVFICNYYVPVTSCRKRPETKVIQLWHSCGLLKKFAYDTPEDISPYYKGDVTANFSLITVSSEACVPVFQKALRLKGERKKIVRATGVSRTDVFFNEDYNKKCKEDFYNKYPQWKGKKIILYAPTFRGTAADPKIVGEQAILDLQNKLGDDWAVIIKLHPHIKNNISNCDIPSSRLFAVADILISDYSSLILEYALYRKPFIIYAPDYEEYMSNRGFYVDPSEYPGEFVTDGSKLADAVKSSYGKLPDKTYEDFISYHCGACKGSSTSLTFVLARTGQFVPIE